MIHSKNAAELVEQLLALEPLYYDGDYMQYAAVKDKNNARDTIHNNFHWEDNEASMHPSTTAAEIDHVSKNIDYTHLVSPAFATKLSNKYTEGDEINNGGTRIKYTAQTTP